MSSRPNEFTDKSTHEQARAWEQRGLKRAIHLFGGKEICLVILLSFALVNSKHVARPPAFGNIVRYF